MSESLPFHEAEARLSELADRVEHHHERVLVTRNGRPSFVLLDPDDLESLEETIEIHRDKELTVSLRCSQEEAAHGTRLPLRNRVVHQADQDGNRTEPFDHSTESRSD